MHDTNNERGMPTNPVTIRWDGRCAVVDGDDLAGEIRRLDIRALSVTIDASAEVRARLPEWFDPRPMLASGGDGPAGIEYGADWPKSFAAWRTP